MSNGLTSPRLAMLQRVVDDETCELGVRLEALSRLKNLELDMSAATPEPKPVPNNHPAIADVVAAELVALHEPMAREVATDVMARKAFGLAKYGTPLQPFNGMLEWLCTKPLTSKHRPVRQRISTRACGI
jgi:hypothetical protein